MKIQDLIGKFTIVGSNQTDSNTEYRGELSLTLSPNNQLIATWNIHKDQIQTGIGFYHDNILVINFSYMGDDTVMYKGVVVYKCLTKDVLDGFWSEEFGDPHFVGKEQCFRIKNELKN